MHERQAKAQHTAAAAREAERRTESDEAQAQPAAPTDAPPPMLASIFTAQTARHTPLANIGDGANPYATADAFAPSATSPCVAGADAGAGASAGEEEPQQNSHSDSPYGDERAVRCTASDAMDAPSTFQYATPAAAAAAAAATPAAATPAAATSESTRRSARRT